jgi:glucose-6-phosphate 1-epimerase
MNHATLTQAGVQLDSGLGGLKRLVIRNALAEAHLYLHGATLTHYEPAGARPVLFVSRQSVFDPRKAIRGGVPICWPWFGPHPTDPDQPQHGPARISEWSIHHAALLPGGETLVTLGLTLRGATLRYSVTVGESLTTRLVTTNDSPAPLTITEALHTYLAVGDVRQVGIEGLAGVEYIERNVPGRSRQTDPVLRIERETDRQYLNTPSPLTLTDPSLGRRIVVTKRGSNTTVVWNPWIDRAKALADLADDEWQSFVCIETANAADNAVTIAPGATHEIESELAVAPLA